MTITQALETAHKRVKLIHFGRDQYQVHQWSDASNAWWMGDMMDRRAALEAQFTKRVQSALELLGFGEDAYVLANSATFNAYPMDWRQCVRDEIKADKLAKHNATTTPTNGD